MHAPRRLAISAKWSSDRAGGRSPPRRAGRRRVIVDVVPEQRRRRGICRAIACADRTSLPGSERATRPRNTRATSRTMRRWRLPSSTRPREANSSRRVRSRRVSIGAAEMLRAGSPACNDRTSSPKRPLASIRAWACRGPDCDHDSQPLASDADGTAGGGSQRAARSARRGFRHARDAAAVHVSDATFEKIVPKRFSRLRSRRICRNASRARQALKATGARRWRASTGSALPSRTVRRDHGFTSHRATRPPCRSAGRVHADVEPQLARVRARRAALRERHHVAVGTDGENRTIARTCCPSSPRVAAGEAIAATRRLMQAQKRRSDGDARGAQRSDCRPHRHIVPQERTSAHQTGRARRRTAPIDSHLGHGRGAARHDVWSGERCRVRSPMATVDEASLLARAQLWQQKLA